MEKKKSDFGHEQAKPGHLSLDDAWHMKRTHGDKMIGGETQARSGEVYPCYVEIKRNKLMW